MQVIYKEGVLLQISRAISKAKETGQEIDHIILSAPEGARLAVEADALFALYRPTQCRRGLPAKVQGVRIEVSE